MLSATVAGREGLCPVLFHTAFEAACWAVFCPGLRIGQTAALMRGLAETHGHVVGTPEGSLWVFPPPHVLVASTLPSGRSALKWQRLELVARTELEGGLDAAMLRALPVDEAVGALRPYRSRAALPLRTVHVGCRRCVQ